MRRIAIVGCGGSGKTTLANRLGSTLGLPVVHLDQHYWRPGWVRTPDAAWREKQRELTAPDRWIIDGHYSSTLELRFRRADYVIVLAFARWRCLRGVVRRWLAHHGDAVQAPGCPERVSVEFLRWIWNYPNAGRRRLDAALAAHAGNAEIVELRTPREVTRFLAAAR